MYKIYIYFAHNLFCAVIVVIIIVNGMGWPCLRFVLFRSEIKFRREIDRMEKARARNIHWNLVRLDRTEKMWQDANGYSML